jgi:hypothetical protein
MARKRTEQPPEVTREDLLRYRGDNWTRFNELGDAGFRAIYEQPEVAGSPAAAAEFMGLRATSCSTFSIAFRRLGLQPIRRRWSPAREATETVPSDGQGAGLSELALRAHKALQREDLHTVPGLSDALDCGVSKVRSALDELRAAGYDVRTAEEERVALQRIAVPVAEPYHAGWGEHMIRFGVVSDTHCENLFHCHDELEGVYDFFAREGITTVLHAGDLSDGPANRGFRGHANEVREDCHTARQCARHIVETYPRRDGMCTLFIESGKSHAGWAYAADGFDMGGSVSNGFGCTKVGPRGDVAEWVDGREDMEFLGYDERTILMGPESRTRVCLHHPDGGSAYAVSYQPQKWAESIEGGSKPHVGILGHYHKCLYIRPRNIQVVSAECMCWQTPFMRRKRIEAHVGFFLMELTVETDGTVRSCHPWEFPFYLGERRTYALGSVA